MAGAQMPRQLNEARTQRGLCASIQCPAAMPPLPPAPTQQHAPHSAHLQRRQPVGHVCQREWREDKPCHQRRRLAAQLAQLCAGSGRCLCRGLHHAEALQCCQQNHRNMRRLHSGRRGSEVRERKLARLVAVHQGSLVARGLCKHAHYKLRHARAGAGGPGRTKTQAIQASQCMRAPGAWQW